MKGSIIPELIINQQFPIQNADSNHSKLWPFSREYIHEYLSIKHYYYYY